MQHLIDLGYQFKLIKTLHTVGKFNWWKPRQVTKTSLTIKGTIVTVGECQGKKCPCFRLIDENAKTVAFPMYERSTGLIIDANSALYYTYEGATEKDKIFLEQFKDYCDKYLKIDDRY